MLLSAAGLRPLMRGVLTERKTETGIVFSRFRQDFRDYLEDLQEFAAASAGIHLAFETDASSFRLNAATVQVCDPHVAPAYDIYFNGVLRHHVPANASGPQELAFAAEDDTVSVDIWVPFNAEIEFRSLELTDASFCRPSSAFSRKWLFAGDSISQGFHCAFPSLTVPSILSRTFGAEILNQSIGGYSHRRRFLQPQDFVPELVFVALGTNDQGWAEPRKKDVSGFYEDLRALYPGIPAVVITPYFRFSEYDKAGMEKTLADIQRCTASMENCLVIDGLAVSAHCGALLDDGLHPNAAGMQYIAANVIDILRRNGY